MDLRRLRVGEWIVGASGLLLLIALFLPWYELSEPVLSGSASQFEDSATGWESFSILDLLLALGAVAAVGVVVVTAAHSTPALPLAMQSLLTLVGVVLLVLVLFRIWNAPELSEDASREIGAALGLVGTFGIAAGCLVAIRDERRAPEGRHNDLTGVPIAAPRDIETIPAPSPEAGS